MVRQPIPKGGRQKISLGGEKEKKEKTLIMVVMEAKPRVRSAPNGSDKHVKY